ncbi:MAG: imidazole glycerol phosphate synthase subunit HisH [Myxococcota bacterium]
MSRAPLIAVVDFGAGNLRSVAKALERSGLAVQVVGDSAGVRGADGVVLPGVGAFADAIANLREKGLDDALCESISAGRPYLGLCLGLQVLFEASDEHGETAGLSLLPGRVARFSERDPDGRALRVPHIGWNQVRYSGSHPMLERMPAEDCYYFVHSYRVVPTDSEVAVGLADYGGEFAAAVATERMFAVQFHPEKSQGSGKVLLDAYAAWVRS